MINAIDNVVNSISGVLYQPYVVPLLLMLETRIPLCCGIVKYDWLFLFHLPFWNASFCMKGRTMHSPHLSVSRFDGGLQLSVEEARLIW